MKNTRTDKKKYSQARPGSGKLTVKQNIATVRQGENTMACPNICGESLLRVMRVADDIKISERLGVSEMEGAGVLIRILENDSLLKREKDTGRQNAAHSTIGPAADSRQMLLTI
jgi:hypothetical protein